MYPHHFEQGLAGMTEHLPSLLKESGKWLGWIVLAVLILGRGVTSVTSYQHMQDQVDNNTTAIQTNAESLKALTLMQTDISLIKQHQRSEDKQLDRIAEKVGAQ